MNANDPPSKPIVMISHTATQFYLAKAWRGLICSIFGLTDESVWFSSEPDAIDAGRPFEDHTEETIRAAQAIICIQSPVSRMRPWILWECGIAVQKDAGVVDKHVEVIRSFGELAWRRSQAL